MSNLSLSQAIRLGAMLAPQAFNYFLKDGATCAMGAALQAGGAGEHLTDYLKCGELIIEMFPLAADLHAAALHCPEGCGHCRSSVWGMVAHLNNDHKLSRERIATWIETIEAQQPAIDHEHATPEDCPCESAVSA